MPGEAEQRQNLIWIKLICRTREEVLCLRRVSVWAVRAADCPVIAQASHLAIDIMGSINR